MKNIKQVISGALVVALLATTPLGALAVDAVNSTDNQGQVSISSLQDRSYFDSFSGIVKKIEPFVGANGTEVAGWSYIYTENAEGDPARFLVTADTYWVTDTKIAVDAKITGYYDANAPRIMIYPPQYKAEVLKSRPLRQRFVKQR